jgi:hypothetical protein
MKQSIKFYDCTFILCKYAPVSDKKMSVTAIGRNVTPRCYVIITSDHNQLQSTVCGALLTSVSVKCYDCLRMLNAS